MVYRLNGEILGKCLSSQENQWKRRNFLDYLKNSGKDTRVSDT